MAVLSREHHSLKNLQARFFALFHFLGDTDCVSGAKIQLFSEETNRFYKLYPTSDAPTAEISGVRMHRVQERTPWQDTQDKMTISTDFSIFSLREGFA